MDIVRELPSGKKLKMMMIIMMIIIITIIIITTTTLIIILIIIIIINLKKLEFAMFLSTILGGTYTGQLVSKVR